MTAVHALFDDLVQYPCALFLGFAVRDKHFRDDYKSLLKGPESILVQNKGACTLRMFTSVF